MICQKNWLAQYVMQKVLIKAFATLLAATLIFFALSSVAYAGSGTPMWVKGLFTGAPSLESGRISTAPSVGLPETRILPSVTAAERDFGEVPIWVKRLEVQNVGKASPYYNEVMGLSGR